jgi:hypothetical protein
MYRCMHVWSYAMPCRLRPPRPSTFDGSRCHCLTSLSAGAARRADGATVKHLTADDTIGFSELPASMLVRWPSPSVRIFGVALWIDCQSEDYSTHITGNSCRHFILSLCI